MTEPFIVYIKEGEVTQLRGGGALLTPEGAQHYERLEAERDHYRGALDDISRHNATTLCDGACVAKLVALAIAALTPTGTSGDE